MIQQIPLIVAPAQSMSVLLGGQSCRINLYQKATGFFVDLYVNDLLILGGIICENLNRIVRSVYLDFVGDLYFNDTQGTDDPTYTGLGSRFQFLWDDAL